MGKKQYFCSRKSENNLKKKTFMQLLTALLLGLLTILDPCTLMTSITAIGYIDKEINNRRKVLTNGLMFVLGKLATYLLLSIPFLMGAQTDGIQHILGHYGEPILAGFMLVCGVVLLISGHHHHEHDHGISKFLQNADSNASWLWSFILGIFFAIAFCPHRLVYFLTMIDITLTLPSAWNWVMPVVCCLRFRNGLADHADRLVGKLQRSEHREVIQQDADLREMVQTYLCDSIYPHRRVFSHSLLYRGAGRLQLRSRPSSPCRVRSLNSSSLPFGTTSAR